jgi:hypothetical protein
MNENFNFLTFKDTYFKSYIKNINHLKENKNKQKIYKINAWNKDFYGFPFQRIVDELGRDIKVVAISAPLYECNRVHFEELKRNNYKILGISSYGIYPLYSDLESKYDSRAASLRENYMKNILARIDGWLYCTREPNFLLDIPKLFYSESDTVFINNVFIKNLTKEYDIIYSAGSIVDYHKYHKNWELAKKCFKELVKIDLKILVIGREKMDNTSEEHPNIILKKQLPYYDFLDLIEKSRMQFIPNISDASPRVISESLMKGVPIIVNENIVGGWKYVNEETGSFFNNEEDIIEKVKYVLNKVNKNEYKTRDWYVNNYYDNKISKANMKLYDFINKFILEKIE